MSSSSSSSFIHPNSVFERGPVSDTTKKHVLHCMYFFSAWQNGRTFSFKKPLLMQSSINKSHRPHYQTVECFIKRTVVQELPVHCMVYLSLPHLSNEIWSCPAVIRPPFWYSQFFFLTIGDHIIGFLLYTYMHRHNMFSYTVLN